MTDWTAIRGLTLGECDRRGTRIVSFGRSDTMTARCFCDRCIEVTE